MEQGTLKDTAGKVEEMAINTTGQVQSDIRDKIEQGKTVWQDAKASAGDALERAASLARDASAAGSQAATQASEIAQDVARQVGNQASQAATALYQQGTTAGSYVGRYTAEQPWTALLLAGAIGYGLAYLIHRP
jgi:ElaB/YqjD/DUF883 family membrane-anchored ribosome-binding protein